MFIDTLWPCGERRGPLSTLILSSVPAVRAPDGLKPSVKPRSGAEVKSRRRLGRSTRHPNHHKIQTRQAPLDANAERPGATELPGDIVAAHDAHHLATDLLFDHRRPGTG
jgi:hypothetical protein